MSEFLELYQTLIDAFEDPTVKIPCCGLKFVKHDEADLDAEFQKTDEQRAHWMEAFPRSLASCGFSAKAALAGWSLKATVETIGCPAGALSLGLVAADSHQSFEGGCYVKLMEKPATPIDFTSGFVYAPQASGHPEFALFGHDDCGRYETLDAAKKAVAGMPFIPPIMKAVYYYHPETSHVDLEPDLVHLYCTPLQAMRLVQGYCFTTGERFVMSCIGIRGVSCDMTAWPYVHDDINGTFLCLGARGISGWEEQYVGFGMPYHKFRGLVEGMVKSKKGFPYELFPKTQVISPDLFRREEDPRP